MTVDDINMVRSGCNVEMLWLNMNMGYGHSSRDSNSVERKKICDSGIH